MAPQRPRRPPKPVVLPTPLRYLESPNQSRRLFGFPYLLVAHRPVGRYGPSISWLRNPRSQASVHVITEGRGTGVDVATQLVAWHLKAWACESFNSYSYNVEVDDDAWDGDDLGSAFTAARIFAFLGWKTGIPMEWTRKPVDVPGICRHLDLGRAGGGHSDPTTDVVLWRWFIRQCQRERDRGDFRKSWGRGRLSKIQRR